VRKGGSLEGGNACVALFVETMCMVVVDPTGIYNELIIGFQIYYDSGTAAVFFFR